MALCFKVFNFQANAPLYEKFQNDPDTLDPFIPAGLYPG